MPLSIPPKKSEKLWFSDVFRGYRKRPVAWNRLAGVKYPGWRFILNKICDESWDYSGKYKKQ